MSVYQQEIKPDFYFECPVCGSRLYFCKYTPAGEKITYLDRHMRDVRALCNGVNSDHSYAEYLRESLEERMQEEYKTFYAIYVISGREIDSQWEPHPVWEMVRKNCND